MTTVKFPQKLPDLARVELDEETAETLDAMQPCVRVRGNFVTRVLAGLPKHAVASSPYDVGDEGIATAMGDRSQLAASALAHRVSSREFGSSSRPAEGLSEGPLIPVSEETVLGSPPRVRSRHQC